MSDGTYALHDERPYRSAAYAFADSHGLARPHPFNGNHVPGAARPGLCIVVGDPAGWRILPNEVHNAGHLRSEAREPAVVRSILQTAHVGRLCEKPRAGCCGPTACA